MPLKIMVILFFGIKQNGILNLIVFDAFTLKSLMDVTLITFLPITFSFVPTYKNTEHMSWFFEHILKTVFA